MLQSFESSMEFGDVSEDHKMPFQELSLSLFTVTTTKNRCNISCPLPLVTTSIPLSTAKE